MQTNIVKTGNTTNYSQFVSVDGNRKISENNVKNIMESIQKHGIISPIAVREVKSPFHSYEVYDGQHTLAACKRLNRPVDYIVYKNIGNRAMINLNNASKRWSMEDYLAFGVQEDIRDYVFLDRIYKEEKLPLTALVILYGGAYANISFKALEWEACQQERRDIVVNHLKEMHRTFNLPQCRHARFIWGFCKVYDTGLYDHKRMMEQLYKCSQYMTKQANPTDYAKNIEMVYNYKKASKNRVKFL